MKYLIGILMSLLAMSSCDKGSNSGRGVCYLSSGPYVYAQGGTRFFLPTAFTPNADGRNDNFRPVGITGITNFSMTVFDRNGNTMFRTIDLYTSGWDGRVSGIPLAADKYAVNFQFITVNGETVNKDFCVALLAYSPANCLPRTLEGAYFFEDQFDVTRPGQYLPTLEIVCPQ